MYIDPSWSYEAWERLSMEHRYCVLHSWVLCRTEEAARCPSWAWDGVFLVTVGTR